MRDGEGFIYVASVRGSSTVPMPPNSVKIGFSLKPEERVRTFGSSHGLRATMLRFMPGTRREEVALHQALRRYAVDRECYPRAILDHPLIPAGLRTPGRDWLIVASAA